MDQLYRVTKEQLAWLQDKLKELKTIRKSEIEEMLAEARSYGDLSENAEYMYAKEEEARLCDHISEIERIVSNAVVTDGEA